MRTIGLWALAACAGQTPSDDDSGRGDTGAPGPATPLADVDDALPLVADGDCAGQTLLFDTPVEGTLPGGWDADLGDWFTDGQVACTPFPADVPGPYSVTRIDLPTETTWSVVARPDPGVDLTLTAWFQAADDGCYPERDVGTPRCDSVDLAGAGQPEAIELVTASNAFEAVILVGLAPGSAGGGYKLNVRNP
ncbi:MAG: hypothetical protein AAF211_11430 [Myxococcota bacterium]